MHVYWRLALLCAALHQKRICLRCVLSDVLSCILFLIISGGVPWGAGCDQLLPFFEASVKGATEIIFYALFVCGHHFL